MKIALCISGHTRGYENHPTEASKLLFDICDDVYISTWKNRGSNLLFWKGDIEIDDVINSDSLLSNYRPAKIEIDSSTKYDYLSNFNFQFPRDSRVNVRGTLLMFTKIKNSIQLIDDEYDVVIRSRFDVTYLIMPNDLKCEENKIYGRLSPINGMPSDILFYGTSSTMRKCVPDESFYTPNIISTCVNAEDVFRNWLNYNGIEFVNDPNMAYVLKNEIRY
jgi:hypothetical protein